MEFGLNILRIILIILSIIVLSLKAAPSVEKSVNYDKDKHVCGSKPAELFFLLDSSSSIWSVDFEKQLTFVNDVISSFEIGQHATRVGVASFSDKYYPNIDLDQFDSKDDLKNAVKQISHELGSTHTYDALDGVREGGLSKDKTRPGVARILVVLTDGESHDGKKTTQAAKKLKDDGIVVFAVGIGKGTDNVELEAIASEPKEKYLFEVGGYGLLDSVKERLAIKACEVEDGPACGRNNPADIMFLVDPVEIGPAHTSVVYEFIGELLPEFNMGKDHIKVGIESVSCESANINLGQYRGTTDMKKYLRNYYGSGLTRMLKRMRTHSYRPKNGGRNYARHMAVLFVDDELFDPKYVLDEARRTKNYDVELFVVAIGDSVIDDEIKTLCSSSTDAHLVRVPSYADLRLSAPELLTKVCHGL